MKRTTRVIRLRGKDEWYKRWEEFFSKPDPLWGFVGQVQYAARWSMSDGDTKAIAWMIKELSKHKALRGKLIVETYIHEKVETWTKV